jgi:peptide deformylase
MRTEGLLARIFQHEIDHLKGVLFIDKVKEIIKGENLLEKMKNEKEQ